MPAIAKPGKHRRCTAGLSLVLAVIFLACCPYASALDPDLDISQYAHTSWKIRDGFAKGEIFAMAQTPDGYIWIGTRSGGLARFDGSRFVVLNPQTTPELQDVEMETLSVDSHGTLWITAGNE